MFELSLRRIAISFAMFAVVGFGSAMVANADVAVINIPNSGLSGTPGPYATVTYTLNGANIDVSVNMAAGFTAFGTGAANSGIFGFNIVGSTAGLNITGMPIGFAFNAAGGQMDGFGNFDVTLSCCNPPGVAGFSFTVSRTGGFSSASQLFEANATGTHFAVHIAPTNGNPTGFAGDAGTPTVETPEPATMFLLGTGLAGLAAGLRRRYRT